MPSPLAGKVPPQGADEVVKTGPLLLLARIRHRSKLRRHLPPKGEGKEGGAIITLVHLTKKK